MELYDLINSLINFFYVNSIINIWCILGLFLLVCFIISQWLGKIGLKGSIASPHSNRKIRLLDYSGVQHCDWCNKKTKAPPVRIALGKWSWSLLDPQPPHWVSRMGRASFTPSGYFDAIIICDQCVKKERKRLAIIEFFEIAFSLFTIAVIPTIFMLVLCFPIWIVTLSIKIIDRIINRKKHYLEKMKKMRYECAAKLAIKLYGFDFVTESKLILNKVNLTFPFYGVSFDMSAEDSAGYLIDPMPTLPF